VRRPNKGRAIARPFLFPAASRMNPVTPLIGAIRWASAAQSTTPAQGSVTSLALVHRRI
jgi:hypothetical protein